MPMSGRSAAIYLRHRQLPRELQPSAGTTLLLWTATLVMLGFALYYAASRLRLL